MLLEVNNLKHTYMPGTPFEVTALKGVTFSVEKGEFLGIMGTTGSGKSTLLQHLNGLLEPGSGTVTLEGRKVGAGRRAPRELRTRVGLVFQHPEHQLFAENVYREVAFGPSNMGLSGGEVEYRVKEALERVNLDYLEIKERSPFELSGGQMRRVALAGVLSMRPEILVLDEPTSGLDPRGRAEFLEQVEELYRGGGLTIIMVSHRPVELITLAERILILHRGELKLQGETREVLSRSEELREMGLELPPAVELTDKLRQRGCKLGAGMLTEAEVCREIVRVKSLERREPPS